MFNLEQWIYSLVTADPTLQGLLASPSESATPYNIYPLGVDIEPENFPAITFYDYGSFMNSTTHMHIGRISLDVWSINSFQEVMTIYTELGNLINFQHSRITTTPVPDDGILWWIREDLSKDMPGQGTSRRLWRKMISYRYWYSNANLQ